jgi:hypothetical protein
VKDDRDDFRPPINGWIETVQRSDVVKKGRESLTEMRAIATQTAIEAVDNWVVGLRGNAR